MLQVYLPVAEISVNLLVMLGLGAAIGFLSGMFGVGGGFLLTPLLIFSGIPPAIAVATGAKSDRRLLGVRGAGAMAQGQYRFPHGSRADRRRHRRCRRRCVSDRAIEQARSCRCLHLPCLRDLPRRDRVAHARREHTRHLANARRQACHDTEAGRAHLDPRFALQDALPAVAPLYQRHSSH